VNSKLQTLNPKPYTRALEVGLEAFFTMPTAAAASSTDPVNPKLSTL